MLGTITTLADLNCIRAGRLQVYKNLGEDKMQDCLSYAVCCAKPHLCASGRQGPHGPNTATDEFLCRPTGPCPSHKHAQHHVTISSRPGHSQGGLPVTTQHHPPNLTEQSEGDGQALLQDQQAKTTGTEHGIQSPENATPKG